MKNTPIDSKLNLHSNERFTGGGYNNTGTYLSGTEERPFIAIGTINYSDQSGHDTYISVVAISDRNANMITIENVDSETQVSHVNTQADLQPLG